MKVQKNCAIIKGNKKEHTERGFIMTLVATQVKRRRGTTAENDAFTGAEGEITVDLTKKELRVHDGIQQGGYRCVRISNQGDISAPNNLISNNGISAINGHVERGVAPSEATFRDIRYQDKNGKWLAGFEHAVHTDKTSEISMIISDMVNDTGNIAGSLILAQNSGGSVVATCPASGIMPNSILTNVACSISGSGYVKFGNGLIIQWGGVQGLGYQQAQWVGLPTPFSTNDYSVVVMPASNGFNYTQTAFVPNQLYTTGFDVTTGINGGTPQSLWCRWIAIGY